MDELCLTPGSVPILSRGTVGSSLRSDGIDGSGRHVVEGPGLDGSSKLRVPIGGRGASARETELRTLEVLFGSSLLGGGLGAIRPAFSGLNVGTWAFPAVDHVLLGVVRVPVEGVGFASGGTA